MRKGGKYDGRSFHHRSGGAGIARCRRTAGAGHIRILESDLREAERKRGKLYAMLALICKEERGDRCGVLENCRDCTIKQTLEECK